MKWFVMFACLFILSGCNLLVAPEKYPAAMPLDIPPPPKTNGTIFQAGYQTNLFVDKVANRIGDVLTVRLEEQTRGEYRALTRLDKKAKLDYPIPTLFGKNVRGLEIKTDTQQKFDGRGNSDQRNRLTGTMSVTVVELLSNSNLVVQGETRVAINQAHEYLQLRGIVRPQDIDPYNTVSSQRIASADITYGARGQAGFATRGGLATKIMNRFFPY